MKNTKQTEMVIILSTLALLLLGCDDTAPLTLIDGGNGDSTKDGGDAPLDSGIDAGPDLDAGDDTDSETIDTDTRSSCERHAEIIAEGTAEACSGKDSECCYCKCYNDNQKRYDYEEYSTNSNCICMDPDPVVDGGSDECSGFSQTEAEDCLDDVEACKTNYVDKGNTGCAMSPL